MEPRNQRLNLFRRRKYSPDGPSRPHNCIKNGLRKKKTTGKSISRSYCNEIPRSNICFTLSYMRVITARSHDTFLFRTTQTILGFRSRGRPFFVNTSHGHISRRSYLPLTSSKSGQSGPKWRRNFAFKNSIKIKYMLFLDRLWLPSPKGKCPERFGLPARRLPASVLH
jgi:hypothetical protein